MLKFQLKKMDKGFVHSNFSGLNSIISNEASNREYIFADSEPISGVCKKDYRWGGCELGKGRHLFARSIIHKAFFYRRRFNLWLASSLWQLGGNRPLIIGRFKFSLVRGKRSRTGNYRRENVIFKSRRKPREAIEKQVVETFQSVCFSVYNLSKMVIRIVPFPFIFLTFMSNIYVSITSKG